MLRLLMILLLFACSLFPAATPKPFAKIGDPVYRNVTPVGKLIKSGLFEEQRHFFSTFVKEAKEARSEGFALEKLTDPSLIKQQSKTYITRLRQLALENTEIGKTVKKAMLKSIKKKRVNAFRKILSSNHSVLKEDRILARKIWHYKQELTAAKKPVKKEENRPAQRQNNLDGIWLSRSGTVIQWHFNNRALIISSKSAEKEQRLEGTWKIDGKKLTHTIHTITNRRMGKQAHTRQKTVIRYYSLLQSSPSTLKVKDIYGDVYELKKQ